MVRAGHVSRSAAALLVPGLIACTPATLPAPGSAAVRPSELSILGGTDRARLLVVERAGDPAGAIALAVRGERSTARALGQIVQARLARAGWREAAVRATSLGVVWTTWVPDAAGAARFVSDARAALGAPVAATDLPAPAAGASAGLAAPSLVDLCSGDAPLGLAPSLAEIESARSAAFARESAAFGAVGERALLDAAAGALEREPAWPSLPPAAPPGAASDAAELSAGDSERLTVALWVPDRGAALGAARAEAVADSALARRAAALGYRLESLRAVLRPSGACLRADLAPLDGGADQGADVALSVTADALRSAVDHATRDAAWSLDRAVLGEASARDAARAAAWRALSEAGSGGLVATARVVTRTPRPDGAPTLTRAIAPHAPGALRTSITREPGQPELWLLLASECGAEREAAAASGTAAALARLLGADAPPGVTIEPWLGAEGVGVVAHAAPLPAEAARDLALRVAHAVTTTLVRARPPATSLERARQSALAALGPTDPAWRTLLGALAPGAPSALDPRGGFLELTAAGPAPLATARDAWLASPLRAAWLGPADDAAVGPANATIARWLWPWQRAAGRCPGSPLATAQPGNYVVEVAGGKLPDVDALIGVRLPDGLDDLTARAAEAALRGPSGWLARALTGHGTAAARSAPLGTGRARAVAIDVVARDVPDAIAAIGSELDRRARLAPGDAEVAALGAVLAAEERDARADPRRRLVDAWRGRPSAPRIDAAALARAFGAFTRERQVVVRVVAKP